MVICIKDNAETTHKKKCSCTHFVTPEKNLHEFVEENRSSSLIKAYTIHTLKMREFSSCTLENKWSRFWWSKEQKKLFQAQKNIKLNSFAPSLPRAWKQWVSTHFQDNVSSKKLAVIRNDDENSTRTFSRSNREAEEEMGNDLAGIWRSGLKSMEGAVYLCVHH